MFNDPHWAVLTEIARYIDHRAYSDFETAAFGGGERVMEAMERDKVDEVIEAFYPKKFWGEDTSRRWDDVKKGERDYRNDVFHLFAKDLILHFLCTAMCEADWEPKEGEVNLVAEVICWMLTCSAELLKHYGRNEHKRNDQLPWQDPPKEKKDADSQAE